MQMLAQDMKAPLVAAKTEINSINSTHAITLPAAAGSHLPAAEASIGSILALVNDLLTVDKLEAGKLELEPTPTDIATLADEVIRTLSSVAKRKNITLVNECGEASIEIDRARMLQVLTNLIANAIKFSERGGRVTLLFHSSDQGFRLGVRDEGPGMDRQTASKIFDQYFQAQGEKKKEGFGLGLAICKLIVECHGGTISVETELGKGSTFWISLPG